MTISMCEAAVTDGLRKDDRSHVHFVNGDGKNGFKKGQVGIEVDDIKAYQSSSRNFQVLQSEANNHSGLAIVDIVNPTDKVNVNAGDFGIMQMQLGDAKGRAPQSLEGYTLFPYKSGVGPWSIGNFTDVFVNTSVSDSITSSVHHELRHVFLGDFGRNPGAAGHSQHGQPKNNADRETAAAGREANKNSKEH